MRTYGWTGPGGQRADARGQRDMDRKGGLDVTDRDEVLARARAWLDSEYPGSGFAEVDGGPDSGINIYTFDD